MRAAQPGDVGGGERLLGAGDPAPVEVVRPAGTSPLFLTCEHAGRAFPARLGTLGLAGPDLERHIAWDIGAAGVARELSARLDATLVLQRYSRLVVDCNRAPGAPDFVVEVSEDTAYPVVHLDDAASALARLATAPDAPQRIYNVASGRVVVREMIAHVRQFLPQARFTFAPDPVIMQVVSGYREWHIDCRRIAAELGWQPRFGVREMVEDIIRSVRGSLPERP